MPAPNTPAEFLNVIPNPDEDACSELTKALITGPTLVKNLVTYMFDSNGDVTTQFATDMCDKLTEIGCSGGTTATTTGGTGTTSSTTTAAGTTLFAASASLTLESYAGLEWWGPDGLFGRLQPGTGVITNLGDPAPQAGQWIRAMAYDPTTTNLYAIVRYSLATPGITQRLVILNKATGAISSVIDVVPNAYDVYSMTCTAAGQLYISFGFDAGAGSATVGGIATLNKATAAVGTPVSLGGGSRLYAIEWDNAGNQMHCIWWALDAGGPHLGTINPATGVVTDIGQLSFSDFCDWYYAGTPYCPAGDTFSLVWFAGQLYGGIISTTNSEHVARFQLFKIDETNGATSDFVTFSPNAYVDVVALETGIA